MSQIVHIISPDGKTRWERSFRDGVPADRIVQDLRSFDSKVQIGFVGVVIKTDDLTGIDNIPHSDRASGYVMDHPDTVIAIGHVEGNDFVEDQRIHGPKPVAASAPTPETKPSKKSDSKTTPS